MKEFEKVFDTVKKINELTKIADVSDIKIYPIYRDICQQNSCGAYGKNHTCPPLIGSLEDCEKRLRKFQKGIIFSAAYPLEDSFDVEGMEVASKDFERLTREVFAIAKSVSDDFLMLSAGGCKFCPRCAAADGLPCRSPENAISSLEGYGMQVSELAGSLGMKYISGANTVTYFGGVFMTDN